MSYNYRLCLTNATAASGGKRAELTLPRDYDPKLYELARRYHLQNMIIMIITLD